MRLLYLTDRLSHRGGAQHHLLDVVEAMAPFHDVTIAAADFDKDVAIPSTVRTHRIKALRAHVPRSRGLEPLHGLIAAADVVHIQNVMNPTALQMSMGPKTVVTIQDHRVFCPGPGKTLPSGAPCTAPMDDALCTQCIPDTEHRTRMLSLTKARLDTLRAAGKLLVLSRYMAAELEAAGLENIEIIPPPVPCGPAKTDAGHGFLLAGRLVYLKGTDLAIEAWRSAKSGHPLRMAGLGAEAAGIQGVEALGWLTRDALRATMADCRALLFPSRWAEPYGIVGVEALAMGTPVIAMARGGMPDWAHCGTLCVDPKQPHSMTSAIRKLEGDPVEALSLGAEGQAWVKEHLSPAAVHQRLNTCYAGLI